MQNATFPINYFKSILTPVRMFRGRKQLTWPKIIFVILFLNGLMMVPITLNYTRTADFTLEPTFPTVFDMIDNEVVQQVNEIDVENGVADIPAPFLLERENGVVAGGVSEDVLNEEHLLLFEENQIVLKEGDLPLSEIPYTEDFSFDAIETPEDLRAAISMQWYYANQTYIVATYSFMIAAILLVMNVFLIFGAAFFIFLASRSGYFEIDSYRESVNLILNAIGLPVMASMLFGLWIPDITTMMSIQTFGLVIIIVMLYFKTRFQEGFIDREEKRAAGLMPKEDEMDE